MKLDELDAMIAAGYPRPRLVRQAWENLSGEWLFAVDDDEIGVDEGWFRQEADPFAETIVVPYPPESGRSGVGDRGPHAVFWYRRRVAVPTAGREERVLLHFGAVDYAATVWVEGELVGRHVGGHTPFSFDVTGQCRRQSHVTIVVRAEDRPDDAHQPRGKQEWQDRPHRIWYERTSGIWQPVWLEVVPAEHVVRCGFAVDLVGALVTVDVELARGAIGCRLEVEIRLDEELLGDAVQIVRGPHVRVPVPLPALENSWDHVRLCWSPDDPRLATVELTVLGPTGEVLDTAATYVGLRSVGARDGHVLVNGRPEYFRLALEQGYWPESHLAAPDGEALRAEVELARSLGFNGVRLHQKVEDPRFLYWADRLGLMVWEEMPSAPALSARAARRLLAEWAEVVERDRDHPCIVAWVPFNESWGLAGLADGGRARDLALAAYHLTRTLDPTRPVISNDGWEHVESDIVGIHDYASSGRELTARYGDAAALERSLHERWPAARRVLLDGAVERHQPVVLSEFGGIALAATDDITWHGYASTTSVEELAARLRELFDAVRASSELAGFCYTQLTDTEQEANGLCWPDRTPKVPAELLREIVGGQPTVDREA